MFPIRISVVTLNLWRDHRWGERAPAVEQCLQTLQPDIVCFQELCRKTVGELDRILSRYRRVDDPFEGWGLENNIYWKRDHLELLDYGTEPLQVPQKNQRRRLYWVRLKLAQGGGKTLLAGTAHFTVQSHPDEFKTGRSPRIEQANRTVAALDRLSRDDEPVLFMGDMNDVENVNMIFHNAGYSNCFSALNLPVRDTFPAQPTAQNWVERPLDWIFANARARCVAATVARFYHGDFAPSDHWPVLAVYEL